MLKASFRDQGIAKVDRLNQDPVQKACSSDKPPAEALAKQIEARPWPRSSGPPGAAISATGAKGRSSHKAAAA